MNNVTFEEIVLAGWLHDIGKFAQRAGMEKYCATGMEEQLCPVHKNAWHSHKHVLYTHGVLENFRECFPDGINCSHVVSLAADHHRPSDAFEWMIAEADRISSGSDRRSDKDIEAEHDAKFYEKPMISLLSTLQIDRRVCNQAYTPLRRLCPDRKFPFNTGDRISRKDYEDLWKEFENDFALLKGLPFDAFMKALDTVLNRYWWCIPSSTIDDSDISLYQHAKLTASWAGVLYRYHTGTDTVSEDAVKNRDIKKFLFINGDISGIQKYIFDLKSCEDSAKLLRARSFQLWALSLILAENLTEKTGGTGADIITSSGGKFLAVLPNTEKMRYELESWKKECEIYFLKEFAGKLCIAISDGTETCGNDLCGTQNGEYAVEKLINRIAYDADRAKQKKMQQALISQGHVLDSLYSELQINGQCSRCNTFPAQQGEEHICVNCRELQKLGGRMVKSERMKIRSDKLRRFGEMIRFEDSGYEERRDIIRINEYKGADPVLFLPYTAPKKEDGSLLCFEEIADKSAGTQKLAMFKADIDNLGYLFTSSLGRRLSFSRYADMSRMFHYFFSGYFASFIQGSKSFNGKKYEDTIYTVFSGGDDLCIIGSWDMVLQFASDFHKELDKLTNNNPSITLSGGIALFSPSTPLRFVAAEAENALEQSKNRIDTKSSKVIKNAVTVFGTTVSWDEYDKYLGLGKKLSGYLQQGLLCTANVYKLLDFAERARKVAEDKSVNPRDLMWLSNFRYMVARMKTDEMRKGETETEVKKTFLDFGNPDAIQKARIAASYALYSNRKDKE